MNAALPIVEDDSISSQPNSPANGDEDLSEHCTPKVMQGLYDRIQRLQVETPIDGHEAPTSLAE